jgi:hypothetical protein
VSWLLVILIVVLFVAAGVRQFRARRDLGAKGLGCLA